MKHKLRGIFLILIVAGLLASASGQPPEEKWSCRNNITNQTRIFIFRQQGQNLEGIYEADGQVYLKGTLSPEGKFSGEVLLFPWKDEKIYSRSDGRWFKATLEMNEEATELSGVVQGKKWLLTKDKQFSWSDKDYPVQITFSKAKEGEFYVGKGSDPDKLFHFTASDKWEVAKNENGFELKKGKGKLIIPIPDKEIAEKLTQTFTALIPNAPDALPDVSSSASLEIDNIDLENLVIDKSAGFPRLVSGQINAGAASLKLGGFTVQLEGLTFKPEEEAEFEGLITFANSCGECKIKQGTLKPNGGFLFTTGCTNFTKDYTSSGPANSGFRLKTFSLGGSPRVFADFSLEEDLPESPANYNGIGVFILDAELAFPISWQELNIPVPEIYLFSNGFRGKVELTQRYATTISSDELGGFAVEIEPEGSSIALLADKFYDSKLHLLLDLPQSLNLGTSVLKLDLQAAKIDENGYFIAGLTGLPGLKIQQFSIAAKEAFFDFSKSESPAGCPANEFQGIWLPLVQLDLPAALQPKGKSLESLELKNAFINRQGFSLEAKLSGNLAAGLGGFEFILKNLELSFKQSKLEDYRIAGDINLPYPKSSPVKLAVEVAVPEEGEISAEITNKETVKFGVFGMEMFIYESSSVQIKGASAEVSLDGKLVSNDFIKAVEFKDLKIAPEGLSGLVHLDINENVKFAKGYDLYLDYLEFSDAYIGGKGAFSLANTFQLKNAELKAYFNGKIEVLNLAVKFDRTPVHFDGVLEYNENRFFGGVKLKIDNLLLLASLLDIGRQEDFEYWYVALEAGGGSGIPLGATGLSIFTLMGAVGYNYDPPSLTKPRGSAANGLGYIVQMGTTFGNAPNGKALRAKALFTLVSGGYFAVDGSLVIMDREKCRASGRLELHWSPESLLLANLETLIYLPDSGNLLRGDGNLEFRFSPREFIIMSKSLSLDICNRLKGRGLFELTSEKVRFNGRLHYEDKGEYELFYQKIRGEAAFDSDAELFITYLPPAFRTEATFTGKVFIAFDYAVSKYHGTAVLLDSCVATKAALGFGEGIGTDGILIDCLVNVKGSVLWFDIDYDFNFSYS